MFGHGCPLVEDRMQVTKSLLERAALNVLCVSRVCVGADMHVNI